MRQLKYTIINKLLAVFLSLIMVFSMIPFTPMVVKAATNEHLDAVTIKVMDEDGQAIKDAIVKYTITSKKGSYKTDTKITDINGVVTVMPKSDFVEDDMSIKATISATDYDDQNIEKQILTGEDNFDIKLVSNIITDVSIEGKNLIYSGQEQELVSITKAEGDIVNYKINGNNTVNEAKGINVGTYDIEVTVIREGKKPFVKNVRTIIKAKDDLKKVNQELRFKNPISNKEEVTLKELNEGKKFDFEAIDDKRLASGTISYSIEIKDGDSDIASISDKGVLTVRAPGTIKVMATLSGNDNYNECVIEHELTVTALSKEGELIKFEKSQIDYIVGDKTGISKNTAVKTNSDDRGKIIYSIEKADEYGLFINNFGNITVNNYTKLISAVSRNDGVLNVEVKAYKLEDKFFWFFVRYKEDYSTYTLKISLLSAPENPYTLSETDGNNFDGTKNDWYKTKATVTPISGYKIAKTEVNAKADNFSESVDFNNQGSKTRYVYLQEEGTGRITNAVEINIKIDSNPPDINNMKIEIPDLNIVEKLGIRFGFYNPEVAIKFIVEDELNEEESGIQSFTLYYNKDKNAVKSISDSKSYNLFPQKEGNSYVATSRILASEVETYRGNISFTAMDGAGNVSHEKKESNNPVIVVDKINPTMSFAHSPVDTDGKYNPVNEGAGITHHYYDSSVEVTFTIEEQNFFNEDVNISVSKNGGADTKVNNVVWTTDSTNDQLYYGKFTLSGDGDYVVKMSYKDQSNNVMLDSTTMTEVATYVSDVITIDETAPTVKIDYVHEDSIQKTIFTVKEHNFNPSHVVVTGKILDINNNPIDYKLEKLTKLLQTADKWNKNGDTYTFETDAYVDGLYNLNIDYTDYSGNKAEQYVLSFAIDHTAPNNVDIEIITNPIEKIFNIITFGFYKPSVTVKFIAYDTVSGVKNFTWNYIKENGASDINRPTDQQDTIVTAVQDSEDKSKFTATITLPDTDDEQLRGYLAVCATDKFDNKSKKVTDDNQIIIVDTIAPEVSIEYSKAKRIDDDKLYYDEDIEATIKVNEANFYESDVVVKISKDGDKAKRVIPTWSTDVNNSDIHYGKYKISGDGDYVISVEYKDKSGNFDTKKSTYSSKKLIIDTIKPIINVKYKNKDVINILSDSENNEREYFRDTQTAVVTITEHNFNADDVKFKIIAKDITGKVLDESTLHSKSLWEVDSTGDIHTITITYSGDANYTFGIDYTDLATNKADDYGVDYFTVDKTKAVIKKIDYSTSVLDTILEYITFGFYNAKMKVTITAEDTISGIHAFNYRYVKANGVSSVNSDIETQEIVAKDIEYSSDNNIAVATFEIPKKVLTNDNQFNGTVEVIAIDRSNNKIDIHKETKRVVVDNIAPMAKVSYNEPLNSVGDISYYDGDINAIITINEANFYANDVQVSVSKDGRDVSMANVNWINNDTDIHVGTFTLKEDGDYVVTINYKDKSGNIMETYTSKHMVIDTKIEAPTFSINGVAKTENGGAYKSEAKVDFNYEDQNFDTQTIKLTRTRFDVTEDVTSEFIKVNSQEKGGFGSFEIPFEIKNDGIYVLSISIKDKANHMAESRIKFTINRYGSVYEYDDYLVSLIKDGGQYVNIKEGEKAAITKDLIITEYNANKIIEDSLKIIVTHDGEVIDVDYTVIPNVINNQVDIGEGGWYKYTYVIKAPNFKEDGVYKITLKSKYLTDDSNENESSSIPDNSINSKGEQIVDTMNFTVDTTKPEIRNIINLDKKIPDLEKIIDGKLNVKYTVVDIGGLKSIEVILNGKIIDKITEFEDIMNYSGEFSIPEDSITQTVQLRVVDIAGNVTDTSSDDFSPMNLYVFNDEITVSRNFFIRWYADKVLFWGFIVGAIILVSGIFYILAYKKRKKEKNE